jgi:uncharacterized membrane protein YbaN (DUF454 family)
MHERDYSAELRMHRSTTVRVLLVIAGTVFVALGVAGVLLPVVPSTPFLLLAAACYARASRRFYNWLLNSRAFGPLILEWQRYHAIPYRTKLTAIALMAVSLSISIVVFVRPLALQLLLAVLGVLLAIYMYRIPSRDHPGASQ